MKPRRYTSWHHGFFLKIFRFVFGPFFRFHYRFRAKPIEIKKTGPYLILANHTAEFDIIFLDMIFDAPLYFVASEQLLNAGKGSWFLRTFFNPIPKSKSLADLAVVKRMKSVLNEGGQVAIFPEGNATMNGGPAKISTGMGRLIKFLGVPVKLIRIQGLYLSSPRWAYFRKFGPTKMEEITTMTLEEIANTEAEDIEKKVHQLLAHSAYDTPAFPYRGHRRAEGLHKLIFTCPTCHGIFTTFSKGNHLLCHACDLDGFYDEFGYVHLKGKRHDLITLDKENKHRFDQHMKANWQTFHYQTNGEVAFWQGGQTKRTPFFNVNVKFNANGVELNLKNKNKHYSYSEIFTQAIQVRTKLILYPTSGPSLLFRFPRRESSYALMMIVQWYKHHIQKGIDYELDSSLGSADTILGI